MRSLRFWGAATLGYVALAVAYFWPLPRRLSSAIGHDAGDPLLNTWILWWTASQTPMTTAWWDAPAFAPMPHSLALSEHLLGFWPFSAPLLWAGVPPLAVYNLLLIASPALCGLAACALALHLTGSRTAAIVAGTLYALAPYRLVQAAHLQILASWWGPIALLALHRQAELGGWRWATLFAVSWVLLSLTSGYHLLFFTIVAAGAGLWLFGRAGMWRRAWPVLATTACACVLLLPLLRTYTRVHDEQGLTRQPAEIDEYSADVLHLAQAPALSRWWSRHSGETYGEVALFPGLALVGGVLLTAGMAATRHRPKASRAFSGRPAKAAGALALLPLGLASVAALAPGEHQIAGLTVSLTTPAKSLTVAWVLLVIAAALSGTGRRVLAKRGPLALYALLAVGTWVMTLGPRARVGGVPVMYHAPYAWLMALPGGLAMRVPPRFWLWTVLALAVVAAFGVAALRRRAPRTGVAVAAALVGLAAMDGWPRRMPVADVAPALTWPSPTEGRVIHLPLGNSDADVAAMWHGRAHGRPVVNGYSGYDPPHYRVLEAALTDGDAAVLEVLAEPAGLLVALDGASPEAGALSDMVRRAGAVAAGSDGTWQFARVAPRPVPPPLGGRRHVPRRVTTVDGTDVTAATTDVDPFSRWYTQAPQQEGQGVVADLGGEVDATALELGLGAYATDYPVRLVVHAQVGEEWQVVHDGPTSAIAVRATLAAPRDPRVIVPLAPRRTGRLRITAGASHPVKYWSISSLAVLGR